MKIYIYYDEDDHPVAEAPTVSELARKRVPQFQDRELRPV